MTEPRRQVAMIFGASSGIGLATALQLADDGWNLVLCARSESGLQAAAAKCAERGAATAIVVTDVADNAAVEHAFVQAENEFGAVAAVVNTAAVVAYGRFEDVPAEVFDRVIVTNLLGTANVARAALQHFSIQRSGHLVLLGSLLGKIAVPYMSPYVTGKWAVHGLTRILQIEARKTPGVRVGLVSPGSVNTPAYLQAANYAGFQGRPPPPIDQPEKVARAIVRELTHSRRERGVGLANTFAVMGFRVLPGIFDLLVTPLMKLGGLAEARPNTPGTVFDPQPEGDGLYGRWPRLWGGSSKSKPPAS